MICFLLSLDLTSQALAIRKTDILTYHFRWLMYVGKAFCLALGSKGVFVTVVDFSDKGKDVAALVEKENAKFHSNLKLPSSIFMRCDVTDSGKLLAFFSDDYTGLIRSF